MAQNVLIANKTACWGRSRRAVARAVKCLRQGGYSFSFRPTSGPGHARRLALEAVAQGASTIVVLGGDGTLNEVANAVIEAYNPQSPVIGIIPTGSSNDFAKSIAVPQSIEAACRTIIAGRTRPFDAARAGPIHFIMASTVGLLATVAAESSKLKGLSGARRYVGAALGVIARMPAPWRMTVRTESDVFEGLYGALLVNNAPRYGGLPFAPAAIPDDGLLDCQLIEPVSRATAIRLVPWVLRGALARHPKITAFRASSLHVRLDRPAPLNNDGEPHPDDFDELEYSVLPGKLRFIC